MIGDGQPHFLKPSANSEISTFARIGILHRILNQIQQQFTKPQIIPLDNDRRDGSQHYFDIAFLSQQLRLAMNVFTKDCRTTGMDSTFTSPISARERNNSSSTIPGHPIDLLRLPPAPPCSLRADEISGAPDLFFALHHGEGVSQLMRRIAGKLTRICRNDASNRPIMLLKVAARRPISS